MQTYSFESHLELMLESVDFDGRFSDVSKSCLTAEAVADILNAELTRIRHNKTAKTNDRIKPSTTEVKTGGKLLQKLETPDGPLGFDVNEYAKLITDLPKNGVFGSSNAKMERSRDGYYSTIHTGLPAVAAIIYDTDKDQFYSINTCPAAGQCLKYCYARKGQFGINSDVILNLTRRLNLFMNDPEEYEEMAYEELAYHARRENRAGRQLRIRWNDSGDFFSDEYFQIANRVTDKLIKRGKDVRSYAYTKVAKYVEKNRPDFVINFSAEASVSELRQVNLDKIKISKTVPKHVFKEFKAGRVFNKTLELKQSVADHYEVDVKRLKFVDELPSEEGKKHQWDVIVTNQDTDLAAQREDVRISYLLIH